MMVLLQDDELDQKRIIPEACLASGSRALILPAELGKYQSSRAVAVLL